MSAVGAATSPYKGLAPFEDTELDALFFFGREREREVIVANLMASRLTVLYGPSGVGKSSLLRAGVAHQLRRRSQSGEGFAVVVFDTWSHDPVAGLVAAVDGELEELVGDPRPAADTLADRLEEWSARLGGDLYVVLDQFDEYFLYRERFTDDAFAEEFPEAVNRRGLRANFLVSIREDALASLDAFKARLPNVFANYLRLDHLDREAGREATVRPIERYRELTGEPAEIEPELVEAVLDEVTTGRVDLGQIGRGGVDDDAESGRIEAAYLQLVLERLWDAERDAGSGVLRLETLRELGGANEIVRAHLERAVEPLSPEQQDLAARIFHHLVTPSGSKIAHGLPDLAAYASSPPDEVAPVLAELGRARILRAVDGDATHARYEIFHDVLSEPVLAWRAQRRLERERQEAERRHRRVLAVAAAALLALAAVTAVALFALVQREHARDAARRAQARELAAQASVLQDRDPVRSVSLAARAARLERSHDIERQLRNASIASRARGVFRARGGAVSDAAMSRTGRLAIASETGWIRVVDAQTGREIALFRHPGGVNDVVFSRDGHVLASAGADATARLWDPERGKPLHVVRHRGAVTSVSLSRDGRWLATASRDGTAKVWVVTSGDELSRVRLSGPVTLARFSPAADRVAAASRGSIRLFDPETGRLLRSFEQPGRVTTFDFSDAGRLLATAGADKIARVWRLDPPGLLYQLRGHLGPVTDVSFSPRGTLLVTASTDGTARVWELGRGIRGATMLGHRGHVLSARFSADGFHVITASRDGTARVWNAESGVLRALLSGHQDEVKRAVFVPGGGARALTWSSDGTARVWDSGAEAELDLVGRHRGPVTSVSFGASARTILSASLDGTARLWRDGKVVRMFLHRAPITDALLREDRALVVTVGTDGLARLWSIDGTRRGELRHGAPINAVAISPDGRELATAGRDGFVHVWDLAAGRRIRSLKHRVAVLDVAFGPSGSEIATAGVDRRARIWSGRRVEHELVGHTDDVTSVAFGPNGRLLVTASRDHDLGLWSVESGELVRKLEGHFALVSDASFSSDARWIVSAGPGNANLWEVRPGSLPFSLRGHEGILNAAAFAPGTHRIVTGGEDGTVRTYWCEICGDVEQLLQIAERRLAAARIR